LLFERYFKGQFCRHLDFNLGRHLYDSRDLNFYRLALNFDNTGDFYLLGFLGTGSQN
jgi:hypothetical protein